MLTHEEVYTFLKKKSTLSHSGLTKESGLPTGTLAKAMNGQRKLTESHLKALEPILLQYGIDDFRNRRATVLSVVNHKGGVGKTTTTINLGKGLVNRQQSVLLIDMDSQGNLSQSLGIHNPEQQLLQSLTQGIPLPVVSLSEGYHVVPSDLELAKAEAELIKTPSGVLRFRNALAPLLVKYDYILIDCPPSLNIYTYSALVASSAALVVLEPEASAVKGMYNLLELIQDIRESFNPKLKVEGIVMAQVNPQLVLHRELMGKVRDDLKGQPFFKTEIRQNVAIAESQYVGKTIFDYKPNSMGATDYQSLADEVFAYHPS
ncbi:ParA family protein [Spirosoma utsteinense]|uniref:ParA family protein n=1 Tax=Spirosoma utsteinense TaxID=2585773 RepID=UPI00164495AD|nr:ParA family protein [Spirosoma utsteinense]MBC3788939.1 chromosome partitioning protein [Spirosoma utsteinense]